METEWTDVSVDPKISGKYEVKNNTGVNGGIGYVTFIVGEGWQVSEDIRSFYKILAWREYEDTFNF